ncbi:hypothetical protein TCSYLVIO_002724 [Trypanosoma cruzi]|nr:hypothetical protein TCSYLVIO_002724 [Trypanosoma cruzi]
MHVEESERHNILRQVWNPRIDISIVLINLPGVEGSALTSVSSNFPSSETGCAADAEGHHAHLFPAGALPFPAFEGEFPGDAHCHPHLVPLMTRCDAGLVLSDESLLPRLEKRLRDHEKACCSRLVGAWPEKSLFATMEHLIRLIPERSAHCTSLVFIGNAYKGGSHDGVSLLESSVRRKNIILSLLFLNETNPFFDSSTNALSQFLSAVGGFGVYFNQWLSLAVPRLNIDWCRRFGGPRCLAQQLFVQLDNKFPVSVDHVSQNMPTTAADRAGDCCVLYNSDNVLEDFTLLHVSDVICVLRCVAEARINEGWSVVMNHSTDSPHVAHLYARFHCHPRRGKLFILYEMEITHPVVYRRVVVSGSKDLVDYFVRAKDDGRTVVPAQTEKKTGWLMYLAILRSQLRHWMLAEQVALLCLLASQPIRRPLLKDIQELSFPEGVSAGWSAHCNVRSIGLFFRWEDGLLHFLDPCGGGGSWGNMPSVSVLARRVLVAALRRRHKLLSQDEPNVFLSLASNEPSSCYVVQVFLLDNEFENGYEGCVAAGFECRFSFFLTGVDEELQALADVIADVRAGVSATRSAVVGKTCFTLAVEAGIDEANARALHLTFCTVLLRRLDLIASHIEPSPCGRNVASKELRSRRARRLYSSVEVSRGEEMRTFRHLTSRCFLTPYLVSPWVLSDAIAFHWMIGAAEMWRTFAAPSFSIFVARRVRDGFRLLHCMGCCKAILYATRLCGGCHAVEIFDVIEAPLEGGSGDLPAQVIIDRFIRPFEFAISSLYGHELTADISEDIQVATVLHTFKVFSSAPLTAAVDRPVPLKDLGGGFVQLFPRLESLLPFLSARHAHTITLRSLPSMGGKGDDELRETVALFVASLGDRSAAVDASALPEGLRQKLCCLDGLDGSLQGQNPYFVSVLMPMECNYLTFLVMHRVCHDTSLRRARGVNVHVISLGTAALFRGVIRLYGRSGEEEEDVDGPRLPDSSASFLLNALTKLLFSFCSLYQAWRLLEERCDGVDCQAAEEAVAARDVLQTFSAFQDYCKEVDISYLLYVQESKWGDRDSGISLQNGLRSLIASMVRSVCLRPLPTNPAIFLPVNGKIHRHAEQVAGDVAATNTLKALQAGSADCEDPAALPFLMRIALFLVSEDGRDVDCVSVLSPEHSSDEQSDAYMSFWSPIASDEALRASQRRLLLRFFVKTAPRQLVDLSRDRYNPPAEVTRRIFGELLRDRPENQVNDAKIPPRFFAKESSVKDLSLLFRQALPFDELPKAVQGFFDVLASDLARSVACHCLTECLHSAPFEALRSLVQGEATNTRAAPSLTGFECENKNVGKNSNDGDDDEDLDREAGYLRELAQESQEVLNAVPKISGLAELLAFAVSPALLSAPCFEADSFTVEFTQQFSSSCAVSPALALSHVFQRCLADDLVCVFQTAASGFLFVPNRKHFALRWIFICVTADARDDAQRVCLLFSEHEGEFGVCRRLCENLRRLIEAKIREVCQLHLLKQLRDTQNAQNEWMPRNWGDQFSSPPSIASGNQESTASLPAAFYCRGSTVLKLPIYYKLQHQCKKILSRITSNCSRLELINIYNREQCFVVADDVQTDVFHFIRLVFVRDTAHLPSLTVPSPSLSPADRCPLMVVQLFGSTKNALVKRPLRKLQDYCFFLAIQELQGHLNYVQHKLISRVDLIFLQCRRRDPVIVDLVQFVGGEPVQPLDVRLAFALVALGLKENKFKSFHVQDGGTAAMSNFAEYYGLVEEERGDGGGTGGSSPRVSSPREMETRVTEITPLLPTTIIRFVKVMEGATDMLVSCNLRVTDGSQLVVDRFLTKMPEERYTPGGSETKYLGQIEDVVRDAVLQWRFFAFSKRFYVLPSCQFFYAVEELMAYGAGVTSTESSTLRFRSFSLSRVSHAVFPFLVERLVGVFEPFSPICLLKRPNAPPLRIAGFPWRWIEQMQRDLQAEQTEVYLTCGYRVTMGGEQTGEERAVAATRAVQETHPDLPVSRATVLTQSPLLKEHNIEAGMPAEPRVVARISLSGVTAALFNLRDSDILLRLMGHVIAMAEQQSDLLHDIMTQRMGLSLPSYLTEPALARCCCGDYSNVTEGKRLCIQDETYRRRINHVRFPSQHAVGGDALTVIVEGLFNRGLLVNGVFVEDDAIRVLYNECPQYSLKECKRILQGLMRDGLLVMAPGANNRRLVHSNRIPDDALIGCDFHRHIQTAHILVESQHARWGIAESLYDCESFLNVFSPESEISLAKLVVLLQGRSRQIFGSRVRDFTLPRRLPWCLSDDILDPSLPPRGRLGSEYRLSVDATLESYVQYLLRVFPRARVIDLDANNAIVSSDATLLHRFRCRYGKFISPDGSEIRFVPHLYYVLIPIGDAERVQRNDYELAATATLRRGGLFVVQVGFQVAHFAIDVFMASGGSLSASMAALAAAKLKRDLIFSSVLYDLTVNRMLRYVQMYASLLFGQLLTSDALETLVQHYPNPPCESLNFVCVFDVEESCVRRARKMTAKNSSEGPDSNGMRQLIPRQGELLLRESTQERYHYCGVMVWATSRLFVLLSTVRDVTTCDRCPNSDLPKLALSAKRQLLQLLLDGMLQQRLDFAWRKIRASRGEKNEANNNDNDSTDSAEQGPSREDLQTLQAHWRKHRLPNVSKPFLEIFLDWKLILASHHGALLAACEPNFSLHLFLEGSGEKFAGTHCKYSSNNNSTIALTLASCQTNRRCFTVVEFSSGSSGCIESAALYRGTSEGGTLDELLNEEEAELIEQTLKLLSSALWGCIHS